MSQVKPMLKLRTNAELVEYIQSICSIEQQMDLDYIDPLPHEYYIPSIGNMWNNGDVWKLQPGELELPREDWIKIIGTMLFEMRTKLYNWLLPQLVEIGKTDTRLRLEIQIEAGIRTKMG